MELREHCRRGNGKAEVPEDQEITIETVSLSIIRSSTCKSQQHD